MASGAERGGKCNIGEGGWPAERFFEGKKHLDFLLAGAAVAAQFTILHLFFLNQGHWTAPIGQ